MATNVLVCHRDGLAADALRSYLTEQGFRVGLAQTFDAIVERAHPTTTCLVDMGMSDSRVTINRIVTLRSRPRVLALVSHEVQIRAALEAGADACVAPADGLDRLVTLLRSDIVVSPRASADIAQHEFNRHGAETSQPRLTTREIEVLAGLVRGESTKALAARLNVRPATARTHVQHLLAKLGVHSRLQAVAFAIENPIDSLVDWSRGDDESFAAESRTAG